MRIRNEAELSHYPRAFRDAVRRALGRAAPKLESHTVDAAEREISVKALAPPVHISVHTRRKRLIDIDNVYIKAVIDGIRDSGLLPDDRPEYVAGYTVTQEQSDTEETIVTIQPIRRDMSVTAIQAGIEKGALQTKRIPPEQ